MLVNSVHRRTSDQRGSQYGLDMTPLETTLDQPDDMDIETELNSTSDSDTGAEVLSRKWAKVKLVLVVMDALLVLHRLANLYLDVLSFNSTSLGSTDEATSSVVNLSKPQLVASDESTAQLQVIDNKHEQPSHRQDSPSAGHDLIDLQTPSHRHGRQSIAFYSYSVMRL